MAEDTLPTAAQESQEDLDEEDVELYSVVSSGKRASGAGSGGEMVPGGRVDSDEFPFHKIEFMHDVPLRLSVEIGQTTLSVRDILALNVGKVVEFTKVVGEPMDITVSGRLMARGEIVVVNERYGVRISEVTRPDEAGTISYGDS